MSKTGELQLRIREFIEDLAKETDAVRSSDRLLDYLRFTAMFHRYSLHNCILIYCQCPQAKHVAGFQTWKKLGRYVRKGEKGIAILAPIFFKTKKEDEEEEQNQMVRFQTVYVFDVSQTEGEDLPACPVLSNESCSLELTQALVGFAQSKQIEVIADHLSGSAFGASYGGKVVIDKTLAGADHFAVLAHEVAHELLNHHAQRKEGSKKVFEIEAETVAHVVCQHFHVPSAAPTYLAMQGAEGKEVSDRLESIVYAIQSIIQGIESHLDIPTHQQAANS